MGYSVCCYCHRCNEEKAEIWVGSGMKTHPRVYVPGYCPHCKKLAGVYLDHPVCKTCHNQLALLGTFHKMPEDFITDNRGDMEFLVNDLFFKNYKLVLTEKGLIPEKKTPKEKYLPLKLTGREETVCFIISPDDRYTCPDCGQQQLQLSIGGVIWD